MSDVEVHALSGQDPSASSIHLEGPEARHIVKVLRHGVGDEIRFSDGRGGFLLARIDRASPQELHAEILRREEDPREAGAPWSVLGLALLKGDHFELALEKCTELGVHRIVPLRADHCVVKWKPSAGQRKLERWRRVVESAMKQSGRSWRPEILEPLSVADAVRDFRAQFGEDARVAVADEADGVRRLGATPSPPRRPHLGLVGPEGAFSEAEKQALRELATEAVSLGPYRLRSETAAIALVAALNEGI